VARTAGPPSAALGRLSQLVEPGDEIVATIWGLSGWSLNLWMVATEIFAVLLALPFALGLHRFYNADLAICGTAGVLVGTSFWIRPALVIAVTRRRLLLCCRISRPFQRMTVSHAPIEAAQIGGFRRGWLFSQLRYVGPGTSGKTIRLNIPPACRQAAQAIGEDATRGLMAS
jgi:hypothetical protein